MGAISQLAVESWYSNYAFNPSAAWAEHSTMELSTSHGRPGRLQFNSLSGGQPITSLNFKFNKTNSGGGGYLRVYVTDNASLTPSQVTTHMAYLGELPIFGSGTGWKTLAVPASMLDAISQFTGTWYLVLTCSVYVTFYGQTTATNTVRFEGEHADGSMYTNDGGVWKISTPISNDAGVWKDSVAWCNDGGVWKQGIP